MTSSVCRKEQLGLDRHPDRRLAGLGHRRCHCHGGKPRPRAPPGLGVADVQIAIPQYRQAHEPGDRPGPSVECRKPFGREVLLGTAQRLG
jgi:hypothetical protein